MEPSSSTSSSEAARPWIWAAFAIAAIEVTVALAVPSVAPIDAGERFYSAATEPTFSESVIDHQVHRIDRLEQAPAVVVVGDSTALTSAIPREISPVLGGAVVENLGTIAPLGVSGHADVLERYLARHPAPQVVVYIFTDASLSSSEARLARLGMQTAFRSWMGVEELVGLWPSHRLRPHARQLIGHRWHTDWDNDRGIREFMDTHAGYCRETHGKFDLNNVDRIDIPVHPDALPGVERLIEMTRGKSELLFVRGPIPDALMLPGDKALHAANEALLRRLRALGDHVHVATPYLRVLPAAAFGTPTHPKLRAAIANSRWLGEQIRVLGRR